MWLSRVWELRGVCGVWLFETENSAELRCQAVSTSAPVLPLARRQAHRSLARKVLLLVLSRERVGTCFPVDIDIRSPLSDYVVFPPYIYIYICNL